MCQTEPPTYPENDPAPALSPSDLVRAYCAGAFPMAEPDTGEILWYSPDPRAVFPIGDEWPPHHFKVRRSLARRIRKSELRTTRNTAFPEVIAGCAKPRPSEPETWISPEVAQAYIELHDCGLAHSVEVWRGDQLAGGIYGVALGGAFFGESMFSNEPYASQIALATLMQHLKDRGYTLFDVQFVNPHLEQFGVIEVPREDYLRQLASALAIDVTWEDESDA